MKVALGITAALFVLLLALSRFGGESTRPAPGLPWDVAVAADCSTRVFGLVPGRSRVQDAIDAFGAAPQIAIVGRREDAGSLEAFFDGVDFGGIAGRIVVTAQAAPDALAAMRARAIKVDYMESATLRATLAEADLAAARAAPIRAIAFAPGAKLDEAIVTTRFGMPDRRLTDTAGATHFLYPARGLDIAIAGNGKALLQYVAPADFARLTAPLDGPAKLQ